MNADCRSEFMTTFNKTNKVNMHGWASLVRFCFGLVLGAWLSICDPLKTSHTVGASRSQSGAKRRRFGSQLREFIIFCKINKRDQENTNLNIWRLLIISSSILHQNQQFDKFVKTMKTRFFIGTENGTISSSHATPRLRVAS